MINENELTREELIQALNNANGLLKPVIDKYVELDTQKNLIYTTREIIDHKSNNIIWALVKFLFWIGILSMISNAVIALAPYAEGSMLVTIALWVFLIGGVILVLWLANRKTFIRRRAKKDLVKFTKEYDEMCDATKRLREDIIRNNAEAFSFIPERYRWPKMLSRISAYLQDKRADTFKEALNLLESECITDEDYMF